MKKNAKKQFFFRGGCTGDYEKHFDQSTLIGFTNELCEGYVLE